MPLQIENFESCPYPGSLEHALDQLDIMLLLGDQSQLINASSVLATSITVDINDGCETS